MYKIFMMSVVPVSDNVIFEVVLSADGTNYDTTNGNYHNGGSTDGTSLKIVSGVGGASGELLGVSGEVNLFDITSTAKHTAIRSDGANQHYDDPNYQNDFKSQAFYLASTAAHTAIKLLFSSGNIESGEITLFGIVNS